MPRHDASDSLLDAAERLFAEQGVAQVSDRRIAEAAKNSNHSAVRYYFGGRAGLLTAIVQRHHEAVQPLRRERQAAADSLLADLRAMVMPQVMLFEQLGAPSWRARALAAMYADPAVRGVIKELGHDPVTGGTVFDSIGARLADFDREVVAARAKLLGVMTVTVCAELEEREAAGEDAPWLNAGWFLCDALAGMLQAPVSEPPVPAS